MKFKYVISFIMGIAVVVASYNQMMQTNVSLWIFGIFGGIGALMITTLHAFVDYLTDKEAVLASKPDPHLEREQLAFQASQADSVRDILIENERK